jgi:hypothetical protein
MDRILPDPGDHAEYAFLRQPSAGAIRYPWGTNNISEQLTDMVGRAHRAGRQLDAKTAARIDTTMARQRVVLV